MEQLLDLEDKKKKISNNGTCKKKKIPEIIPRDKRESKSMNMSKITNLSISKRDTSMHINYLLAFKI